MSTLNTSITYNGDRDKSFGLLRTNPKLTTNVKIVVDSNESIFLSSFSATKQLASSEFKRFKLDSSGLYSMDLSRFYGNVPMTERFEVMRKFSDVATYNEYSKQFENQYNYGAEFNDTKLYDEQYRFLAPIWLTKDIPSNFVVYRVETATSKNIQNPSSYLGQNEKIMDMLGNATIVANFDLSRRSKIGEYIRNHVEDITMPSAGLTFNFDTEEPCMYRGIDVKYGGFANKEEYLADDYIRTDDLEINKNQLLTEGFERNGLAFSNILNLEFMFNDTTGEKYKTYRYFGLYVDSVKEGSLKLSSVTSNHLLYNSATSVYDVSGLDLSDEESRLFMVPGNGELNLPTLNYIKDKNYNLYHIKNKSRGSNENKINLNIPDLDAFKGYSKKHGTLTIDQNTRSFKSFIRIKIKDVPNHLDRFFIGNRFTMEDDSYNMGTYTILADSSLPAGQYSGNTFSNQGTLSQIAVAISNVIKNTIDEGRVKVTPIGEYLTIESYVVGEDRNMMMFGVYNNNLVDFIEIITSKQTDMGLNSATSTPPPTITFTDWSIHTLRGGAGENQGMFIESSEHGDVAVNDYIKEKDLESYVRIIDIVRDSNGKDYRVILKKPAVLSNNGIVKLYNKFDAEFGKLSAYDLKDLRFDFHDNDISGLGSLEFDLGFGAYELDENNDARKENLLRFNGLIDNVLGPESVGKISNLYGRLKENELKETAILSRIVPHINTFARKDSSNIRGNDYILNVNESMGVDNMSPNTTTTRSDYRFMNIEHYTMGQLPKLQASIRNGDGTSWAGIIPSKIEKSLYNIDDSLIFAYDDAGTNYTGGADFDGFDTAKAKDTAFDYFSLFESFNGYYNYITSDVTKYPSEAGVPEVWENMKKVNHSDVIRRGTVFSKGVQYNFSESLDGYRFMNILRYEHSTDTNDTSIEVIKNEKWETLVIFTTIKTKANVIPEYGLTKGHMYSIDDITTYSSSSNLTFGSLRASLNPSLPAGYDFYGEPGNLNYLPIPLTLVDTPIKSTFNYGGSTWPSSASPGDSVILNASAESILAGDARFNSQIIKNSIGEYPYIIFTAVVGGLTYAAKILDVISDTSLLLDGYPVGLTYVTSAGVFTLDSTPYTVIPSNQHDDFELSLHDGGLHGFRGLFDSVCVGSVAKRFRENVGISYTTVDLNGSSLQKGPRIKIIRPYNITKASEKRAVGDTDKPNAFAVTAGSVGYNIVDKEIKYITRLSRYSGDYNPAVKNIISFDSIYNQHKLDYGSSTDAEKKEALIYGKFNGLGIAFESYKNCIKDYGIIKNFYYHKVNEDTELDIIKLSESSDKLPLYPSIGEIAIDRTDLNILDSKYSESFFKRGLIGLGNENAHGTKSAEEVKAFMASTIMKVNDIYNIDTFGAAKQNASLDSLNTTYEDDLNKASIHFFEDEYRIFADFYLTDALRETLITDGISHKFSENVNASKSYGDTTTLDDDISEYVKHNIVDRYIIDEVDVYVNESRDIQTGFSSDVSQLDDYKKSTSHNLESFNDKELGFRFIFEKRVGYKYDFKLNIKIKA